MPDTLEQLANRPFSIGGSVTARFRTLGTCSPRGARDTVFELAPITKQFTATGILVLIEEGKVQVDDPILRHLPNGPESWKGITIRHLLRHTSGLPGLEDGFKAARAGGPRLNYSTAQLFDAAGHARFRSG